MHAKNLETSAIGHLATERSSRRVGGGVNFRKFLTSSSSAFAVRGAATAFSFLMNVVVVRVLGAHEAGLFLLGQTFLLLLAMFSRIGLDNVLVRFVSTCSDQGKRGAANGVLLKALALSTPLAILTAAATYSFSDTIAKSLMGQPEFAPVLRTVAIGVIPFAGFQLLSFALQGRKRFVWSMFINAALLPLFLLIAASCPDAFGVESAVSLTRIGLVVVSANFFLALTVWCLTSDGSIDSSAVRWRECISTTIPLFCIVLTSNVVTWTPLLVLAAFVEPDQVAAFTVSQRTAALFALFLLPINSVASPTMAALCARHELTDLREFVRRVNGVIVLVCVPLLALVFVFSPQILSIFGPQFRDAKWVLRLFVLAQLCGAITGCAGQLLIMSGNERSFRNLSVVSAVLAPLLAFLLIPKFGVLGAAIAGASSLLVWHGLIWWYVHLRLRINILKPDFGYAIAAVRRGSTILMSYVE